MKACTQRTRWPFQHDGVTCYIQNNLVKTLIILSTHRPCLYLCTISRPERSLQYRRCCTIRQSVHSEPALRLWCAALVTRPFSYQWRPCAPVRRPRSAASVISETWNKRLREFCGIVRLKGSRTLIVALSEYFLIPVLRSNLLYNYAGDFLLRNSFFMKLLRSATLSDKFKYAFHWTRNFSTPPLHSAAAPVDNERLSFDISYNIHTFCC